jgi:serine/threonine-protein kinase
MSESFDDDESGVLTWTEMLSTVRVLARHGPVLLELARWHGRLVVVKRLNGFAPQVAGRLAREAEVAARLKHPNIVPLLAVRDDALIYEYCPGVNLAQMLAEGPLSIRRSLQIIGGVLTALAFAHDRNVIHFDVKPANIMVRGRQSQLTDFGFAKDLAMAGITQEQVMGTPGYMAPEQFRGQRHDPRSDLYAAGAVLYHMLCGEPPYGSDIIRFLVGHDPPPLEPLPPAAAFLQEPVERALRFRAEDRFATAAEMGNALRLASMVVRA